MLLVATAIAAMIAIEFTYSSTYAKHVPSKKQRMHARGLAYALLACIGILLVVVVYALSTEDLRRACRSASQTAAPFVAAGSSFVGGCAVSSNTEPFTDVQAQSVAS